MQKTLTIIVNWEQSSKQSSTNNKTNPSFIFSDEDEDYKQQVQQLRESIPFAVVGANAMVEVNGKKIRGRQYPWGIVEIENPAHCDFVKLRTMLITHMQDLQVI